MTRNINPLKVFCLTVALLAPKAMTNSPSPQDLGLSHLMKPLTFPTLQRIVGGTPSSNIDGRANSVVQLVMYLKTSMYPLAACTGTIISESHILTAAHCFDFPDLDRVDVFMGSTLNVVFPFSGPINFIKRTVYKKDIIIHEDFNVPHWAFNNIAILRLRKKIYFDTFPYQIRLTKLDNSSATGLATPSKTVTPVGWGVSAFNASYESVYLQQVDLTVDTEQSCVSVFQQYYNNTRQFCNVIDPHRSVCYGDSGGPVFIDDVLVGITSFGMTNCTGGVFTRASAYEHWIKENMVVKSEPEQFLPYFPPPSFYWV